MFLPLLSPIYSNFFNLWKWNTAWLSSCEDLPTPTLTHKYLLSSQYFGRRPSVFIVHSSFWGVELALLFIVLLERFSNMCLEVKRVFWIFCVICCEISKDLRSDPPLFLAVSPRMCWTCSGDEWALVPGVCAGQAVRMATCGGEWWESIPAAPCHLLVPQDKWQHQPMRKEMPDSAFPEGEGGVAVNPARLRHSSGMGWYLLLHFHWDTGCPCDSS